MRVRLVGLVALMALVLASCGGTSPEAGNPSEGIQVHGDWTIDIYNEDGSLDESRQFSNALQPSGAEGLVELLAGAQVVAPGPLWTITVEGECDPSCQIGQVIEDGFSGGEVSVEVVGGGSEPSALLVTGSTEFTQTGTIERVRTSVRLCDPDDCFFGGQRGFTSKTLEPEDQVDISEGQSIQVTVEISFTSG